MAQCKASFRRGAGTRPDQKVRRPQGRAHVRRAALSGQKVTAEVILTGPEKAILTDLWGLRWAVNAALEGVVAASSFALPAAEEASASRLAKFFAGRTPSRLPFLRANADATAGEAIRALRASMTLINGRQADGVSAAFRRETWATVLLAERCARSAAKKHRTVALLTRELEGVH